MTKYEGLGYKVTYAMCWPTQEWQIIFMELLHCILVLPTEVIEKLTKTVHFD